MSLEPLKSRIARLRLDKKTIAAKARLDEATIGRALNGITDPRSSTITAIEAVVSAEESALREYLGASA